MFKKNQNLIKIGVGVFNARGKEALFAAKTQNNPYLEKKQAIEGFSSSAFKTLPQVTEG
ncbi:MAG: hypothetical protein ACKOW3_06820 [Hyphomicrobium sp.]